MNGKHFPDGSNLLKQLKRSKKTLQPHLILYIVVVRFSIMTSILKDFDKLRKHITTEEGKELAKEFRKQLKRSEKYADKLDTYFTDTLDGMPPEKSAYELGLL